MRSFFAIAVVSVVPFSACPDPAKDRPKATVSPSPAPAPPSLAPLAGAVPFTFSSASSTLGFTGAKVTGKHDGGFRAFKGALEVVSGELSKSRVAVDVSMDSVFTDSDRLTGHLKSADFFDVAKFPTARFVSSSITAEGAKATVTGDLTLHGVTKRISFPATIALTDAQATVSAEFAINRKDFDIVYAGKADDLIADAVLLKLAITAAP